MPLPEPDWREAFEADGFEETLTQWRRFHCTGDEPGKRIPASAIDGIIILAGMGILPPRSELRDLLHDPRTGYQCDEHCWLSISGEQWRIVAIEDRMLHLEQMTFTGDEPETRQIDLSRADWTRHTEAAVAILEAMR